MSKKKRAAKLARANARKDLIAQRVDEAWASFTTSFPSPYASADDNVADRALCDRFYRELQAELGDAERPSFFEEDSEGFRPAAWVARFRDELMVTLQSEDVVDARVRFQVAQLFRERESDRFRDKIHPDHLRIMSAIIRRVPLFPSQPPFHTAGDLHPPNPYDSQGEFDADCELVTQAWGDEYGDESLAEDFSPPLFVSDGRDPAMAPWTRRFRDLMIERYGSLRRAEPRIRYVIASMIPRFAEGILDRLDEAPI